MKIVDEIEAVEVPDLKRPQQEDRELEAVNAFVMEELMEALQIHFSS